MAEHLASTQQPSEPAFTMSILQLVEDIGAAIRRIDASGERYRSAKPPHREYAPGVGPFSETALCQRLIVELPQIAPDRYSGATTHRFPDIRIPERWAIELKLARPFGDNGKEAEHWSQNLLHPYPGNTSSISDALKLVRYQGSETPVIVVIGYEHQPAQISLDPLIESFEAIARSVLRLQIGRREQSRVEGLAHPVHQVARVWAWPVLGRSAVNCTAAACR